MAKTADDMRVDVTIGVPKPEAVDKQAVLEPLPHGGLQVLNENGDDGWLRRTPSSSSASTTANSESIGFAGANGQRIC